MGGGLESDRERSWRELPYTEAVCHGQHLHRSGLQQEMGPSGRVSMWWLLAAKLQICTEQVSCCRRGLNNKKGELLKAFV